ncbi:MAG: diguanylate cyclase [Thermoleophilia bacterium]|nr:diguanylate cyclase [Thermoleophilia bacterium]
MWLSLSSAPLHDDAGATSGRVVMLKDVTASRLAELERRVRDNTDPLTGVANHTVFQERLRDEAAAAAAHGTPLSLVLFDVDHLKRINQLHGHRAGDEVLRETSRRVMACARPDDLFARVGGEKFALLMPGAGPVPALAVAERIRQAIAGLPVPPAGRVTISAGVASVSDEDGPGLYTLADGARYWAKSTGRDRCVAYDPAEVTVTSGDEYRRYLERQGVLSTIRALARAVDARDVSTREHSDRVASLASRIALELGWDTHSTDLLYDAGLLHDIGKIGIPDAVLFKPGRLTPDEYALITTHSELGAQIVAGALSEQQVAWVRGHHERWGGGGYPDDLSGDDIPEGARILALADAWDVMTIARTYSTPRPTDEAVAECVRESGAQFWPEAVDVLVRLVRDGLVGADGPDDAAEVFPPAPARAADAAPADHA